MLNNSCQFKIQAHRLNRNRISQDITAVYDVTSKESINKHHLRRCQQAEDSETKEAKFFSKFEAELVDVMNTLQHAISPSCRRK